MQTTLSTNRLQNVFSRFSDNENKRGLLFENDAVEQETKLRVHVTQFAKDGSLAMAQTYNVLTIPTLL